jgi:hypothetical protein
MMKKAETHGLTFRSEVGIDGDALKAPIANSYKDFAYGLYAKVHSPLYRVVGQEPDVRDDGSRINVNETIDASGSSGGALIPSIARLISFSGPNARTSIRTVCTPRADDPRIEVPDSSDDLEAKR